MSSFWKAGSFDRSDTRSTDEHWQDTPFSGRDLFVKLGGRLAGDSGNAAGPICPREKKRRDQRALSMTVSNGRLVHYWNLCQSVEVLRGLKIFDQRKSKHALRKESALAPFGVWRNHIEITGHIWQMSRPIAYPAAEIYPPERSITCQRLPRDQFLIQVWESI